MAVHKFQGIDIVSSLSAMGIYQIVNGAVTTTQLTNESQLSDSSRTWGSFSNTSSSDIYHVYFFFNASSVVINTATTGADANKGSTYSDPSNAICSAYTQIYNVSGTSLYAIRFDFPERYEQSAGYEDYTSDIDIKTNEDAVHLDRRITIRHTYCAGTQSQQ